MEDLTSWLYEEELFFNREEEVLTNGQKQHHAPTHLHQSGKLQMITFRLADALPQEVIANLRGILNSPDSSNNPYQKQQRKIYLRAYNKYIDAGYGECLMKKREVRRIVESEIMMLHNMNWVIDSLVIMPNHLHILARVGYIPVWEFLPGILRRSGDRINRLLNREGNVWQGSYYETIIRNKVHYHRAVDYIRRNPRHLPPSTFYYTRPHPFFS